MRALSSCRGGVNMRYAVIDGGTISDRAEQHRQLARVLELPDWYGANLDALYDWPHGLL